MSSVATIAVWCISAAAVIAMLVRPFRLPEWIWAVAGAIVVAATGLLPIRNAVAAVGRGADVYAFLLGILTLAEVARAAHLFDWLAGRVLRIAGGSTARLFGLIYLAGVGVTALLSNDTTIVVLTPAVLAACKRTNVKPLPHLLACAFVANAASFVLPVSNPANLVVFDGALPALRPWLGAFGLAAVAAVVLTYLTLRAICWQDLRGRFQADRDDVSPGPAGAIAAWLVSGSTIALLAAAWLGLNVGYTAFAGAAITVAVLALRSRATVLDALRHLEWTIVFLVAGLFVIVSALDRAGAIAYARDVLHYAQSLGVVAGNLLAGASITVAANLFNNLPIGLVTGFTLSSAPFNPTLAHAALVAVDVGPNLSVTGSLATLLWLLVLRREGVEMSGWRFLRYGVAVLPPALIAALLLVR